MESPMHTPAEPVRIVHLDAEQLLTLEGGHEGCLRVLQGGAWLTEEGERQDTFLQAGQVARVRGRRAVVQADGVVDLELTWGRRAVPVAGWRRLRALAARWQLGPVPLACP
jgi:hypothetical protein